MFKKWRNKKQKQAEKEIEKYINKTFCCEKKGDVEISVTRIEYRQCYDTTWHVTLKTEVGTETLDIVRFDNETAENLMSEIKALENITKENILSLDKKKSVYYD